MSVHTDRRNRTWEIDVDRITWIVRRWAQQKAELEATSISRGERTVSPQFDSSRFASDREANFTRKRATIFRALQDNGQQCLALLANLMADTESLRRRTRGIYDRASRQAMALVDERVRFGERGLAVSRFIRDASVTVLCSAAAGAQGIAIATRAGVAVATAAGAGASDYAETGNGQHAVGTAAFTLLSAVPGLELGANASRSVKAAMWVVDVNRSVALSASAGVMNGDRPDAALRASLIGEAFSQATGSLPDVMTRQHQLLRELRGEDGASVLVFLVDQVVGTATSAASGAVAANINRVRQQPSPSPRWVEQTVAAGNPRATTTLRYETEDSRFQRRLREAQTTGRRNREGSHRVHKRYLTVEGILAPLDG